MASKETVWCLAVVLQLLGVPVWTTSASDLDQESAVPEILVTGDVIIETGDNATVDCIGEGPLQWSWQPEGNLRQMEYPDSTVSSDPEVIEDGIYKRTLRFTRPKFFHTAVYYCDYLKNSDTTTTTASPSLNSGGRGFNPVAFGVTPTSSNKKQTGASVKVFVSDARNMFIKEAPFGILFVSLFYGHEAVLPCAVSNPTFNVTLFSVRPSEVDFTNRDEVTFDPIQGFIITSPYYVYSGTFKCVAQTSNKDGWIQQNISLALKYTDTELVPTPRLLPSSRKVLVGENFSLTCTVAVKPTTHAELHMIYKQKGQSAEKRVTLGLPMRKRKMDKNREYDELTLMLEIHNVTLADSGEYGCEVIGMGTCAQCEDNKQQSVVDIKVFEEPFIHLKATKQLIKVNSTAEAAYLFVAIDAYSVPKLQWFYNGHLLQESIRFHMSATKRAASLLIVAPRTSYSGVYSLHANTQENSATVNITLHVYGKPEVRILPAGALEEQVVVQTSETVKLLCQVDSILATTVTWLFQEASSGNFTKIAASWGRVESDSEDWTEQSISRRVYRLTVTESMSGWYRCSAANDEGMGFDDIKYIVADPPVIQNQSSGVQQVSELSDVTLMCSVEGNPPPQISWYKDDTVLNVTVSDDGSLTLRNVTSENAGNYRCSAQNHAGHITSESMVLRVGEDTSGASFSSVHISTIIGVLLFTVVLT